MRRIYFCCLLFSVESFAIELAPEADLVSFVSKVRANSALLKMQQSRVEAAKSSGEQAGKWGNPSFYAELGRLNNPAASGPTFEFRLSQPFFFPGKLGNIQDAHAQEVAVQQLYFKDLQQSFALDAVHALFALKVASAKASHYDSRFKRISLMRTAMRSQTFASPQKIVERNVVAGRLINMQKQLDQNNAEREILKKKITIYTGDPDLQSPEPSWIQNVPEINEEHFTEAVVKGNWTLKIFYARLRRQEAELALQRKSPYPDLNANIYYRQEVPGTSQSNEFFGAGVSLPLPLVNRNSAGVQAAEKTMESQRHELDFKLHEIRQMARALYAEYVQKRKTHEYLATIQLPQIDRNMAYADREFKLGRLDLLTYLEIEVQSHEIFSSYYENQLEMVHLIARMIYALGESAEFTGDLYVFAR